jgi:hypothetical protein
MSNSTDAKPIALAEQGRGSNDAMTLGVLDRLLGGERPGTQRTEHLDTKRLDDERDDPWEGRQEGPARGAADLPMPDLMVRPAAQ